MDGVDAVYRWCPNYGAELPSPHVDQPFLSPFKPLTNNELTGWFKLPNLSNLPLPGSPPPLPLTIPKGGQVPFVLTSSCYAE